MSPRQLPQNTACGGGRLVTLITPRLVGICQLFRHKAQVALAAAAIESLPARSCVVDGEAIVCDDSGLAVFDLIRGHGINARAVLHAFDLLEVNGEDIRPEPIEDRKRRLAGLLRLPRDGIALNEQFKGDGTTVRVPTSRCAASVNEASSTCAAG